MADVILNVYDAGYSGYEKTNAMVLIDEIFKDEISLGRMFHCAVQGSGVFSCPSTKNPMYTFRQALKLGRTSFTIAEVKQILQKLSQEWPAHSYDSVSRNCNHFCDEFCERLGVPLQHLPLKKRRYLFRPKSPQVSPTSDDIDKIPYQSCSPVHKSLSLYSDSQSKDMNMQVLEESGCEILHKIAGVERYHERDLLGLELLATAAASMYIDSDNPIKDDVIEVSSMPKSFNAASLATDSEVGTECNKSDFVIVREDVIGNSQSLRSTTVIAQGLVGSIEDENKPGSTLKVDRRHWDLNTMMDSWDHPCDDLICRNISEDVNDDIMPESQKHEQIEYLALPNLNSVGLESCNVEVEEIKFKAESPNWNLVHLSGHEEHLEEPIANISSNFASEFFAAVNEKVINFPATSVSSTVFVEKIETSVTMDEKIDRIVDPSHDLDLHLEGQGQLVDRTEIIMSPEGSDSPYEDGELRRSFVYSQEDNESDINYVDFESQGRTDGSEIVDGGSEGSHGSDKKSTLEGLSSFNGGDSRVLDHSIQRYTTKAASKTGKIGGKNASKEESATDETEGRKWRFTDPRVVHDKVGQVDEYMLKAGLIKIQSPSTYSSRNAVDENDVFFMKQCRLRRRGCPESFSERDTFFDKYSSRYRPHFNERDVADQWTNWCSRSRSSRHLGVEGQSMASDDRDDNFGAHRRLPRARYEGTGVRGNYSRYTGRQDNTMLDGFHVSSTHERSRSTFRTRTTSIAWHSLVERKLNPQRQITSLDFRSEARIDETRLPFSKPTFSSDHRKRSYLSPSRGRLSPDRSDRWSDNHKFEDSRHMKRRRSPLRVSRRSQRLDTTTSDRPDSDKFFRPTIHTGRFSLVPSDDKDHNNKDRKHDSSNNVMMHVGRYVGDGRNLKRFRHNKAVDDFKIGNSNEDNARTYLNDIPRRRERKFLREAFQST